MLVFVFLISFVINIMGYQKEGREDHIDTLHENGYDDVWMRATLFCHCIYYYTLIMFFQLSHQLGSDA